MFNFECRSIVYFFSIHCLVYSSVYKYHIQKNKNSHLPDMQCNWYMTLPYTTHLLIVIKLITDFWDVYLFRIFLLSLQPSNSSIVCVKINTACVFIVFYKKIAKEKEKNIHCTHRYSFIDLLKEKISWNSLFFIYLNYFRGISFVFFPLLYHPKYIELCFKYI